MTNLSKTVFTYAKVVWWQVVFKILQKNKGGVPKPPTDADAGIYSQNKFSLESMDFDQFTRNK